MRLRCGRCCRRLTAFVRDLPVVGHNIAFDLGFLARQKALLSNESLDTFELAGILVPHEERYLARQADTGTRRGGASRSRALGDAHLAHQLFVKLFDRACQIPTETLKEIVRLSQKVAWTPGQFFEDALNAAARGAFEAGSIGAQIAAKQAAQKRKAKKAASPAAPCSSRRWMPGRCSLPVRRAARRGRTRLDAGAGRTAQPAFHRLRVPPSTGADVARRGTELERG